MNPDDDSMGRPASWSSFCMIQGVVALRGTKSESGAEPPKEN